MRSTWAVLVALILLASCAAEVSSVDGEPTSATDLQRFIVTAPFDFECEANCAGALTVLDEEGIELRQVSFRGSIRIFDIAYPGRVLVIEDNEGELRPQVVDVATGEVAAAGFYRNGFLDMSIRGQPNPRSRFFQVVRTGEIGGAVVIDMETLQVYNFDDIMAFDQLAFSADDGRAMVSDLSGTTTVYDTSEAFEPIASFASGETGRNALLSPDGTLVVLNDRRDDTSSVLIGDVETGEVETLATGSFATSWFDDDRITVVNVGEREGSLLDVATGRRGPAADFSLAELRVSAAGTAWRVADVDETINLVQLDTGEQRIIELNEPMQTIFGRLNGPRRYIWASVGGVAGNLDRLGVARIDLLTGEVDQYYSGEREGLFVAPDSFLPTPDGSRALVATSEGSFYLGPDEEFKDLRAASGASWCDDESFLLVGPPNRDSGRAEDPVELYVDPGSEPVASFGFHDQAVCVG